ncbi:MAG: primosomal protein N' [Firmicutes bacterium]|nr:primosomal protein N' [Bacillota bacterium]
MREYAEVIIDLVSNAVDQPFHYRIPPELRDKLTPGMKVKVPLGNRGTEGYVLRLLQETTISSLRDIIAISDPEPVLTGEQISLLHWLSNRYYCRKIDALHAMVPVSFRQGKKPKEPQFLTASPSAAETDLNRAPAQKEAIDILISEGSLPRKKLEELGVKSSTIRTLEKRGLVEYISPVYSRVNNSEQKSATMPQDLQTEQAGSFKRISEALGQNKPKRILLHGITASGKTEVYMQSIAACLERGRTALILVPEIALTPQMIEHFEGRFPGTVSVLHSRLTPAEKALHWQKIKSGEAGVVLGARSAVFAPLSQIGLIVIDEEHETTYKQEEAPRYHARDVAWWRARHHRAVLLLGSATPSLESYYGATEKGDLLLSMNARVTPVQLPPVQVVDMRQELRENHRKIFSRLLLKELEGVMERDEQALLFINRRGFAGFVLCRECGYVVRCPSCDVSLTLHLDRQLMCCHYCGHEAPVPQTCPDCGGIKIRYFSAGTQRVEDEIKKLYPKISLIRMDSDTTTSRQAHSRFYHQFRERKASLLIGTQMIAKGFDFPDVTLVGVVAADTALNLPDFRAPERTFQLLTQVSGRTARGERGGKVVVQTYHPSHYSILAAAAHDYRTFYAEEIEKRRQLAYPPFTDLIRVLFSGSDEKAVFEAASWMTALLEPAVESADIMGPAPASLYRIKDMFRVQTVIKGEGLTRISPAVKKVIRAYHSYKPSWPVRMTVDFNPLVVL